MGCKIIAGQEILQIKILAIGANSTCKNREVFQHQVAEFVGVFIFLFSSCFVQCAIGTANIANHGEMMACMLTVWLAVGAEPI